MRRQVFNTGWIFNRGLPKHCGPFITNDGPKERISLPHDFVISTDVEPDAPGGGDSGYYVGGAGTYTKYFTLQDVSGTTILDFDGVYQNAYIRVNGSAVYTHHYGYSPFLVDISRYLKPGENELLVSASTLPEPNCRWYTGGGIYRSVYLLRAGIRYLAPWGLWVRSKCIGESDAEVTVEVTLAGPPQGEETVCLSILAPDGREAACTEAHVLPGKPDSVRAVFRLTNVQRWDLAAPNLYTLQARLCAAGEILDTDEVTFGIRALHFTPKQGLLLNGKPLKLYGGNLHHLNGTLGAASYPMSEERRVRTMRENGFNAIRTAHNPPSRAFLEACDRQGVLVIEELFDTWLSNKKEYDYYQYFDTCWERDTTDILLRDRNHPCIFAWSLGNEVQDPFEVGGYDRARQIADKVRSLDSDRWLTLGGIVSNPMTQADIAEAADFFRSYENVPEAMIERLGHSPIPFPVTKADLDITEEIVDMVDLHYEFIRYPSLVRERPDSMIIGTEEMGSEIDLTWEMVNRYPQVVGDFVWPCWDYIGEAGNGVCLYLTPEEAAEIRSRDNSQGKHPEQFPHRTFGDGDFDICGYPRPMNAFHKVVWGSPDTVVLVLPPKYNGMEVECSTFAWQDLQPCWSYPGHEGEQLQVEVYSRAEEVELLLNGVSLGRQSTGAKFRYRALFRVPYAPGTLTAVSYTGGVEVSRSALETVGESVSITLRPEVGSRRADEMSLVYVDVLFTDAQGRRVHTVECPVRASVSGAGMLLSLASGRPSTTENYTSGCFTALDGRLQAVIRSSGEAGSALLHVEAPGYPPAELEIAFV